MKLLFYLFYFQEKIYLLKTFYLFLNLFSNFLDLFIIQFIIFNNFIQQKRILFK